MKKKKEAIIPVKCVCGKNACVVKMRALKMVSCPNPERCRGNLRSAWNRNEEAAIVEWNNLVESFRFK